MLMMLAAVALLAFSVMEQIRSRLLTALGALLEQRLGTSLLEQMVVDHARQRPNAYLDGLRDLSTLRSFLSGSGVVAVFDAPWSVIYLLLIAAFDWRLGFLAVCAALLQMLLTWANARQVRAAIAEVQHSSRATQRLAERSVANAEVVTALGMGPALSQRWMERAVEQQTQSWEAGRSSSTLNGASRFLRQFVQVAMLALGAWLVIHEGATPGVMIATTILLGRALGPVEQLIAGWQSLVEARLAYGRLSHWMENRASSPATTALPKPQGQLAVEQVSYVAPATGQALLKDVTVNVRPGCLLVIVGGSGAGKTTLARLLVGVLQPTRGTVRLDGADLMQYDPHFLGTCIGYLPQDVELFSGTVAENIARFEVCDSSKVISAATLAGAHSLILQLPQGYDTPVGESGRLLSGGQRQRIALARAVFGDPSFVVLDEPDASLDGDGERALIEAIQALGTKGTTVVAVTQRTRLLSVADQVLVMKDGTVERAVARNDQSAEKTLEQ